MDDQTASRKDSLEKIEIDKRDKAVGLNETTLEWLRLRRSLRLAREKSKQNHSEFQVLHPANKYKAYWNDNIAGVIDSSDSVKSDYNTTVGNEHKCLDHRLRESITQREEKLLMSTIYKDDISNVRVDERGRSALQLAVIRSDLAKVTILIKILNSNIINYQDDDGMTALMLSICNPFPLTSIHIFEAILKAGADVNICDKQGRTALHRICHFLAHGTQKDVFKRILKTLLDSGARVDILDSHQRLPIDAMQSTDRRLKQIVENMMKRQLLSYLRDASVVAQHTRMHSRLLSRQLMTQIFDTVLQPCGVCRRKKKDCLALQRSRYTYWLFVHNKCPR